MIHTIPLHPTAKRLRAIMQEKKTNLVFAADLTDKQTLLDRVRAVAPFICVLKTHIDIVEAFDDAFIQTLRTLADEHNFLIMEDRKLADIGHIALQQCLGGVYRIAAWADLITVHTVAGPGFLEAFRSVSETYPHLGLLLIAEMSSVGHCMTPSYQETLLGFAKSHTDTVVGFISQQKLCSDPRWLWFTPGVNLTDTRDGMGQTYRSPESIDSDCLIVGRGIAEATDPSKTASHYRKLAWRACRKTKKGSR